MTFSSQVTGVGGFLRVRLVDVFERAMNDNDKGKQGNVTPIVLAHLFSINGLLSRDRGLLLRQGAVFVRTKGYGRGDSRRNRVRQCSIFGHLERPPD